MSEQSETNPQSAIQNPQSPVTDSPWFWVLMFSLFGLVALAAISGQYGKRQARLERQYQARERVADDALGDNAVGDPARREYSTPAATLVPIWPLALVLGGVIALAAVMLRRELKSPRRERVSPVAPTGVAQPPEASDRAFRSEITTSGKDR